LYLGEQRAGRSRFDTVLGVSLDVSSKERIHAPRYPWLGLSSSGSASSAFTPHTTVVFPTRTRDDPFAVVIEPEHS